MIRILYFARLREEVGISEEIMPIRTGVTLTELLAQLNARGGRWSDALGNDRRVLMAVNQEVVEGGRVLREGDEVAFFPPVTGG
jgi:sulfur-carrier protein